MISNRELHELRTREPDYLLAAYPKFLDDYEAWCRKEEWERVPHSAIVSCCESMGINTEVEIREEIESNDLHFEGESIHNLIDSLKMARANNPDATVFVELKEEVDEYTDCVNTFGPVQLYIKARRPATTREMLVRLWHKDALERAEREANFERQKEKKRKEIAAKRDRLRDAVEKMWRGGLLSGEERHRLMAQIKHMKEP